MAELTQGQEGLIKLLADGHWHSGDALAKQLACSRSAVSQTVSRIATYFGAGCRLLRDPKKGYRLVLPAGLLDSELIDDYLNSESLKIPRTSITVETVLSCKSTNRLMAEKLRHTAGRGLENPAPSLPEAYHFIFADHQNAGQGRRGRTWNSALGHAMLMSCGFILDTGRASIEGLSLAVGLSMLEAVRSFGFSQVQLKWPNDLIVSSHASASSPSCIESPYCKLGGILIELSGALQEQVLVVVGVGLNIGPYENHHSADLEHTSRPIGLQQLANDQNTAAPDVSKLAARTIATLTAKLASYQREGFAPLVDSWNTNAAFINEAVRLYPAGVESDNYIQGIFRGVDKWGRLQLEDDMGVLASYSGGELSSGLSSSLRPYY